MEPIAIVGIGCRFPKANHPDAFWQLLRNGEEAITEVPGDRWNINEFYDRNPNVPGKMNTRWGGFLEQIDGFDADFFGMTADEVEHTDPQQRLFLEVAWEALEHAGIVPTDLAGSQTGVFIGLCTIDYHRLLYKDFARIGPHSGIGTTPCITANRLSYLLDLRGPSISIDAACASSLVTVHLACQSLRSGESDLCLAAGVNLILSPDSTIASAKTRLLSGEGRCKTFDANADGYVRGEGCGVVVLKRLSDAIQNGDNVLALIRGSAMNQDGLSNSLTAPNGLAQQALIRQALRNGRVQPAEISYVEAHAVGTTIGDAVEFKALKTVLMEGRSSDRPCWVGSAKPNIGHLEAASGMAALLKVILSLQHEEIPPHLHLDQLNPYITLENTPFAIPTQLQKWPRGTEKRLAGISAFGFGGTNAHLILEEAPAPMPLTAPQHLQPERPLHLVTLSAKTDAALRALAQRYVDWLESPNPPALADLCFTTHSGRSHFDHRLCIVTSSVSQLCQQLRSFMVQEITPGVFLGRVKGRKRPKVTFLFADKPLANPALGCSLYQTQPTFQQSFDHCLELLHLSLNGLYVDVSPLSLLQQMPDSPPIVFALEYALAELWRSWGITPKAIIGQGIGKYVAACVAGVFSLEDAIKLMAAYTQANLDPFWAERHGEHLIEIAQSVGYASPRIPLSVDATGTAIAQEIATPEYWCQPLQPQQETDCSPTMPPDCDFCLAMGLPSPPDSTALDPVLQGAQQQSMPWLALLSPVGELYSRGAAINWSEFDYGSLQQRVQLPTYPFQRQRYWFQGIEPEAVELSSLSHAAQPIGVHVEPSRIAPDRSVA